MSRAGERRSVFVSGAGAGIGKAVVERPAADGFRVFAGVRSAAGGQSRRRNTGRSDQTVAMALACRRRALRMTAPIPRTPSSIVDQIAGSGTAET